MCDVVEEIIDPVEDTVLDRLGIFENDVLNCNHSVSLALVLSGMLLIMLDADVRDLVDAIVLIFELFIDVNDSRDEPERRLSLELLLSVYDCGVVEGTSFAEDVTLDPKLSLDETVYK